MTDPEVTPTTVVASQVTAMEETLDQLLADRKACDRDVVQARDRMQMREHERDSLDRLISLHRPYLAAWRQVQVFIDSVTDTGPGSVLAAAFAPGRPQ